MHIGKLPGTGISRAQSMGTESQPIWRAASAGYADDTSAVVVKRALAMKSGVKFGLALKIESNNSLVAERISS